MSLRTERRVPVPAGLADLTAAWITEALALGVADSVQLTPIGTGNIATTVRVQVTWRDPGTGPASFVAKIAAPASEQRVAAEGWRAYEVEAAFYTTMAGELTADIPQCYWAGYESVSGNYAVVLEDLCDLVPGDDVTGGSPDLADRALAELALVHAPRWNDPALTRMEWLNRYPQGQGGILHDEMTAASRRLDTEYADHLATEIVDLVRRFAELSDRYDRKGFGEARTITHGDFRNDNLMFSADRVCILDWQTVQLGAGLADVAYHLASSLQTEDRRAHEEELVRAYCERVRSHGVDLDWNTCWREYRRHGLCLLTTALKVVKQRPHLTTGRSADLVVGLVHRAACQALDLDSLALLGA